jgi:Ca2+-transporting ATPase
MYSLRNGELHSLLAKELVPGDIIILNTGDRVPADLRLFECVDIAVDESSFTGETEPSNKTTDPVSSELASMNILQRKNICFMGTLLKSGHGKVSYVKIMLVY